MCERQKKYIVSAFPTTPRGRLGLRDVEHVISEPHGLMASRIRLQRPRLFDTQIAAAQDIVRFLSEHTDIREGGWFDFCVEEVQVEPVMSPPTYRIVEDYDA